MSKGKDVTEVIAPMEARSAAVLPDDDGWWYEPKWDGFRCLAMRMGDRVELQAKSGKPLARYFPEVAGALRKVKNDAFIVDGEILIRTDGGYSFEDLQLRLHPSESRIRKLAAATPASLMLFDMLQAGADDLIPLPLGERRKRLQTFMKRVPGDVPIALTEGTADRALAQRWLDAGDIEGIVAKRLDEPYRPGERAMVKVKRIRTADCVVGGFRYGTDSDLVGSLLLGLYDDQGLLDHVGFTSGLAAVDKPELTRRLEALKGEPGFTGSRPGGPSRWSTERSSQWVPLRPELVVEVSFDHVSGGRFRHGTRLIRFRPDKAAAQCRMEQIT